MVSLDVRAPDLQRIVTELAATEKQVQRALNSTLRKMAAWLRARDVKGLAKELRLKQTVIRRRLKTTRLRNTQSGPQIGVWYGLNPIDLIYLQPRKTGDGVAASGGRFIKGGFIAPTPGGALKVFKRRGTARLPIDKQEDDVQQPAEHYIDRALGAEFDAQFFKVFEHELQWQTR